MLRVISANRLRDGIVVYLGSHGEWVTDFADAVLLTSEEACESGQAQARASLAANVIVDPLLVDVVESTEGRRATTLRNAIRAAGPTVEFQTSSSAA
ncbi:MAG TPA: DUF2849 domain-containing protein [Methylovirgula sp.]